MTSRTSSTRKDTQPNHHRKRIKLKGNPTTFRQKEDQPKENKLTERGTQPNPDRKRIDWGPNQILNE